MTVEILKMTNKVEEAENIAQHTQWPQNLIDPFSRWYECWQGAIATMSFFTVLMCTFQLAFKSNMPGFFPLLVIFDILYIANIVIKFHVAHTKDGDLVTDKQLIKQKYIKGDFILDILSTLPLILLILSLCITQDHVLIKLIRLVRVIRFYSLPKCLGHHQEKLGINTKVIRSFKYLLIAYVLIHSISCGWYMLACPNDNSDTFESCYPRSWATDSLKFEIQNFNNIPSLTLHQRYLTCLYWATITATSTGYGDIHATNIAEKWYSVLSMLLGIGFFFGPILGYMASTLTNSDSKRAQYNHRMDVINDHLQNKGVSIETQKEVKGFYEHLWIHHQGILKQDMFKEFPNSFQSEIAMVVNKHVLEEASLFRNVGKDFTRMVSMTIKPSMYLPKQVIISADDISHTLFYIEKGVVEILTTDENGLEKQISVLKEGSYFGELQLLMNIPQSATVKALKYCELSTLDRADLMKVLKHFPGVKQQLTDVVERRIQEAAEHIRIKDSNPNGIHKKCFTIDKSVIKQPTLTDSLGIQVITRSDVFQPNSHMLVAWRALVLMATVAYMLTHTYIMFFDTSFAQPGYGTNNVFKSIFFVLYLIDLLYVADLWVYCHTVVENGNQAIDDPSELLQRALRTSKFWMSVVAVMPIEIFCFAAGSDTYSRWLIATFLRSNRLLKMRNVFSLMKYLEEDIRYNIVYVRALKLLLLVVSVTHLCACVWFMQACYGLQCDPKSWVAKAKFGKHTHWFTIYSSTLYWAAATMTSTGYGDIVANTMKGKFIVLFILIIGLLMYGYCLSTIAATITNKLSPKVKFLGRIQGVIKFMEEHRLCSSLISRVEKYLGLVWRIHRGEALPGSRCLMYDLPGKLKQDVSFEEMNEIISTIPIFMNTDDSFLKKLSLKLITYVFMPGDVIVYSGDVGRDMYIIRRGLVEVLSKDQSFVVATLSPGSYFGEIGLIFGENRTADVRAKTYCEVAMLRKHDLDDVLKHFPLIGRQLHTASQNKTIISKIRKAKDVGERRSVKRIDLIERNCALRSKLAFRRTSLLAQLTEEESNINDEINMEYKQPYEQLHPVVRALSYLLLRSTFDPHSVFLHTWTAVSAAISCVCFFVTLLQVSFLQENNAIWVLNYTFDAYFFINMYIKLHVCYYNDKGVLVTHPTATAKNYLKTSFLVDFLATVPEDLFALGAGDSVIFNYLKLNRALNMIRVAQYFSYLNEPIGGRSIYRQIEFGIYMMLLTHVIACGWFLMACPYTSSNNLVASVNIVSGNLTSGNASAPPVMVTTTATVHDHNKLTDLQHTHALIEQNTCLQHSWAVENGRQLGEKSVLEQYITSIYWAAATTCSVGYGDIHAYLPNEMKYALFCMIVGVLFYGYVIANAAASLANADAQRARYQKRLDSIKRFLKEQKIDPKLEKRVEGFYEFLWNRNGGVNLENIFEGLPIALQADITLSLYKDIIESVPLFQGTELGFTRMLSLYIQPLLVPKGEYIVRKGDIGQEMFFINKGVVEVVSEHENPIIFDSMSPGRFFGEISTIFSCPRTASIRTQTNADVFVLKKKDLDVVLSHYPHIKKQIIETAEERQNMVKRRAEEAAKAAAKRKEEEELRKKEEEENRKKAIENGEAAEETKYDNAEDDATQAQECIETEVSTNETITRRLMASLRYAWTTVSDKLQFVIAVDSRWHMLTNFNCLLIFLTYITLTYMASYGEFLTSLIVLNLLADASFFFEIFLKFHMAYIGPSGDTVTSLKDIAYNYSKGEVLFDVIANLPLGVFCIAATDKARVFTYLSLVHILRLKRLNDWFKAYLKKLNINVLLIRILENLAKILIALQTFACIWFGIGSINFRQSWVQVIDNNSEETASDMISLLCGVPQGYIIGVKTTPWGHYCNSVYWALATMTSTGYGDIHATNDLEKVFATFVMVIGKLIFGFVLGNVASTIANVESSRVYFEERFAALQSHMRDQNMPMDIQQRVVSFYQYLWKRNAGTSNENLFHDLLPCLHGELCLAMNGDLVKSVPLFKGCELPIIRLLCQKTRLIQFHKHEHIGRKGDIGKEMYFIKKGKVLIEEDGRVLSEGEFFDEKCIVTCASRQFTTRAVTHVDLFCLSNSDLLESFESHPEEEAIIRKNMAY